MSLNDVEFRGQGGDQGVENNMVCLLHLSSAVPLRIGLASPRSRLICIERVDVPIFNGRSTSRCQHPGSGDGTETETKVRHIEHRPGPHDARLSCTYR